MAWLREWNREGNEIIISGILNRGLIGSGNNVFVNGDTIFIGNESTTIIELSGASLRLQQ